MADLTPWQPFATAPKEPIELDVPMDLGSVKRLRFGPSFVARGTPLEGETMEALVCWSIKNDDPGIWWDLEGECPLDWPMTQWRRLTKTEATALEAGEQVLSS